MSPPARILQISGHTSVPRHEAVPAANDALNACGVLLEDMHEYSNRMMTYRFEIDRAEVERLVPALVAAGFVLETQDPVALAASIPGDAEDFIVATLQLTFPDENGDRRIPNPDRG